MYITSENEYKIEDTPLSEVLKLHQTPFYIYSESLIRDRTRSLIESITFENKKILYACKANFNFKILKILIEEGCGIDTVSTNEIQLALLAGCKPENILYTGDNYTDEELIFALYNKILINIGSISQLLKYIHICNEFKLEKNCSIRINPNIGDGHHNHVITGGPNSKFGIFYDKIPEIKNILKENNVKLVGIQCHIGSGILEIKIFLDSMDIILKCASQFPDIEFIDFGGGIGVPYNQNQKSINIKEFGKEISLKFFEFTKSIGKNISLYLEPGRYLVAESGHLITKVTNIKETPNHKFVGTDTGFNHLIRPILYGSYHPIINCSNLKGKKEKYLITGNICETGDVFTQNKNEFEGREINEIKEGDILDIAIVGAYGFSMASNYNMRNKPEEILVKNNKFEIIRKKECFEDLIKNMIIN